MEKSDLQNGSSLGNVDKVNFNHPTESLVTHCLLKTKLEQALENLESLDEDRTISI
jgi:hypothetical protein